MLLYVFGCCWGFVEKFNMTEIGKKKKKKAQLYEEAGFAFVYHSASESQGWVVQIEYNVADYVSISRRVIVHCICTNLSFSWSMPPCV